MNKSSVVIFVIIYNNSSYLITLTWLSMSCTIKLIRDIRVQWLIVILLSVICVLFIEKLLIGTDKSKIFSGSTKMISEYMD